ncbi:SipW-dependent-type signal peptide-containing protein [Peptostreptococcus canis]|uniref:Signal peptide protein n=1 Tax=Peptostreptococcus canis TaxID=1159213 RepID=A0ABR6TM51_9FIRM|nr:SipW-dependent-type signal peptide-containing protein [Peptostreptococcus canis]MBC2576496.1 signal peptide protein [Peptostreptococcus canis]MBP1998668.1 putative ribosomally synthesized peptide with SipW-like signal peptide [Peptostreptococcus canis]
MKNSSKKNLIGGILALSLILAGTGYAYWTDTLNVNTKATTGDFGVEFVDLGLYAQYNNETKPKGWSIVDGIGDSGYVADDFFMRGVSDYNKIAKDGSIAEYKKRAEGYNNVDFDAKLKDAKPIPKQVGPYTTANTNGSDKIELEINKMYPGYAQAFRTDIINIGDIAAKLSDMKFTVGAGSDVGNLEDMIGIAVLINGELKPGTSGADYEVFKLAKTLSNGDNTFTVGGVQFIRLSALKNANIKAALKNNEILCTPTQNRMDLFLGVAMDPDASGKYTTGTVENMNPANDDKLSQKKAVKVSIDLLWDQFNVGKDAANPNILVDQNK